MRPSLFDSFADMIEAISVGAILQTLEREARMVEQDLEFKRPVPVDEAESILMFCGIVEAVKSGAMIQLSGDMFPARHLAFYRKTVARLVEAELLPFYVRNEFESVQPCEVTVSGCLENIFPAGAGSVGTAAFQHQFN